MQLIFSAPSRTRYREVLRIPKRQAVIALQKRSDAYGYAPTERNLVTSDCVDYHHAAYKQISRPELPFLTAYLLSTYRG